jgi:hypothetical protein
MAGKKVQAEDKAKPGPGRALFDSIKEIREYQFKELCDRATRLGAAARARQRLMEGLAQKVGLNLDELRKQQEADWQLLQAQIKEQEKAAAALLKKQSARQRQTLRHITRHADRFEYKKGNPHTSICLWRAARAPSLFLNPQTFSEGTLEVLPPVPAAAPVRVGQNIFRVNAEVIGSQLPHDIKWNPIAALDLFTQHVFEATVPHGGSLSVTASYVPNGVIFLGAPGDFIFAGYASAQIFLFMDIVVEPATGGRIDVPRGDMLTILDREIRASWDGASSLIPVGTANGVAYQLANNNVVQVQAGDLVRVTAAFDIFITAMHRGLARATFAPQPFGINVPMVLLKIDS